MLFYANPVSDALSGTCQLADGLTVALSDPKNDFYEGVDVAVQIDTAAKTVTSVTIELGRDSEDGTHQMTYSAAAPVTGTTAKLAVAGSKYTLTGVVQDLETRHGKKATSLIPLTLVITCAA